MLGQFVCRLLKNNKIVGVILLKIRPLTHLVLPVVAGIGIWVYPSTCPRDYSGDRSLILLKINHLSPPIFSKLFYRKKNLNSMSLPSTLPFSVRLRALFSNSTDAAPVNNEMARALSSQL